MLAQFLFPIGGLGSAIDSLKCRQSIARNGERDVDMDNLHMARTIFTNSLALSYPTEHWSRSPPHLSGGEQSHRSGSDRVEHTVESPGPEKKVTSPPPRRIKRSR